MRIEYTRARSRIEAGKYGDAVAILQTIEPNRLDGVLLGEYHIAFGEARLFLGSYDHDHLVHAIELFRPSAQNHRFALAKYLRGWQLQAKGERFEAKQSLLEAYSAFLRVNDHSLAARALNRMALISFQEGDIAQAVTNLEKAVDCYLTAGEATKASVVRSNLASVYFMSGEFVEAQALFNESAGLSDKLDRKNQCVNVLCRAMSTALTGRKKQALQLLGKAESLVDSFARERAQYFEYLGWISLLNQDYVSALKALKSGLSLSMEIAPESALISQTKRLMGDVYLATGKLKKARKLAAEALAVAEKINERVEIATCYRIFAQVEQVEGTTEDARHWYKKAIDILSLISSRYELAVTRFLAAESGLFPQGETMAMFHLAREYFVSEQIEQYIEAVDAATSRPVSSYPTSVDKSSDGCPTIITVNEEMKKLIDLVDAQRNSLQARLTTIDARYRFYRTLARLTHALGWSAFDRSRMPGDLFFDGVARLAEDGK